MTRLAVWSSLRGSRSRRAPQRARDSERGHRPDLPEARRPAADCFSCARPMKALRDIEVPRTGGSTPAYIDFDRVDQVLRDAATHWIADFVRLYEEDRQLPYPEVPGRARISLPGDQSFDVLRSRAGAHQRAAPAARDQSRLGRRGARRRLHVPDSVGPVAISRSAPA